VFSLSCRGARYAIAFGPEASKMRAPPARRCILKANLGMFLSPISLRSQRFRNLVDTDVCKSSV
jgi:hypothetical protein